MKTAPTRRGLGQRPSSNRHQAIAEAAREGSQNSQAGAAGFGAAPQYYGIFTSRTSEKL